MLLPSQIFALQIKIWALQIKIWNLKLQILHPGRAAAPPTPFRSALEN